MTPAIILALALMATSNPPPAADTDAEPLPAGAPTDPYELSAWCYGALGEYLTVYDTVKPDLRDIDKMFGTPVLEDEPYQADMAAARQELKMIGESVTASEKASPRPIAPIGVAAIKQGAGIWAVALTKPHRALARAWLTWALPDRCDTVARQLQARSALLGKALTYNNRPSQEPPRQPQSPIEAPPADVAAPAPPPPAQEAAPPAAEATAASQPTAEAAPPASQMPIQAPESPPPATAKPEAPAPQPSDQSSEPIL